MRIKPGQDLSRGASFGLLKFVSWGALVLILLSSLFLSIFLANQASQVLLDKQRDFARFLADTLNSALSKRVFSPAYLFFGGVDLSKPEQYKHLDDVVREVLKNAHVQDARLYDMSGVVIYALDSSLIGKQGLGGEPAALAVAQEKFYYDFIYQTGTLGAFFSADIAPRSVIMRITGPLQFKGLVPVAMAESAAGAQPAPSGQPGQLGPGEGVEPVKPGDAAPGAARPAVPAAPAPQDAPQAQPALPAQPAEPGQPGSSPAPAAQNPPQAQEGAPAQGQPGLAEVEGVIGGLEFTLDITADYQKLVTFQRIIILANLVTSLVIFLVLRMLIHRADRINAQRQREKEEFDRERIQNEKLVSMGRMVAGIAHEIRNPLGIIRSSAELLVSRQKDKDPLTAKILTAIHEESVRLSKTVGDFLDYARPRTLKLEPVDLATVLDQVLAFLEQKCRELGVEVVREYAPGVLVQGDKDLLYRAFYNILANAMEAMAQEAPADDGPVRGQIVVRAGTGEAGARLTVLDTGPGIPEDIRDKLLDPFFTTKESGTGLGLAITANILRSHGASIEMGDNPGGGARVDILFPRT